MDQIVEQGRSPEFSIKRFGRDDFELFHREAAKGTQVRVGPQYSGPVEIDCKYLWRKAQWGTLGDGSRPAGIVYMDLNFIQPSGYALESATVYVTIAEHPDSYALGSNTDRSTDPWPVGSDYAVQITQDYGPRRLVGPRTLQRKIAEKNLTPNFAAAGVEIGGLGYQSSIEKVEVDSWNFQGFVRRPKKEDGLRTMQWQLNENALDHKQLHQREYCTAFAFEHSCKPVFMRVEVDGKLRSKRRNFKHDCLRFTSRQARKDQSTLTQIHLLGAHVFHKRLDDVASGLDKAMQMDCWRKTAPEMPNSLPVSFWEQRKDDEAAQEMKPRPTLFETLIDAADKEEDPILGSLARGLQDLAKRPSTPQLMCSEENANMPDSGTTKSTTNETSLHEKGKHVQRSSTSTSGTHRPSKDREARISEEATDLLTRDLNSIKMETERHVPPEGVSEEALRKAMRIPIILFFIRFLILTSNYFLGETAETRAAVDIKIEKEETVKNIYEDDEDDPTLTESVCLSAPTEISRANGIRPGESRRSSSQKNVR